MDAATRATPVIAAGSARGQNRALLPVFLCAIACLTTSIAAEKTDVVKLVNGDEITGEIKELDRGQLRYKTDSMGTVNIEWVEVVWLTSNQTLRVELKDGAIHFGSLEKPMLDLQIRVAGLMATTEIPHDDVVRLTPIEKKFIKKIDGSVDLGFSYTAGSEVGQFTFSADATYKEKKYLTGISASSVITNQPDQETTLNNVLSGTYNYLLKKKRFASGSLSFEQNTQLGFDLRILLIGLYGKLLTQSNHTLLSVGTGLATNTEFPVNSSSSTTNLELPLVMNYSFFRYNSPKMSSDVRAGVFPSLTAWGRYRVQTDANWKREMVADFMWGLRGWLEYDSEPATGAPPTTDWGVVMTVGYTF